MNERFNTTSAATPLTQEREYTKYTHSLEQFVLSPTGKNYTYWGSIGLGFAFTFMAIGYGYLWLLLPALGFSFAGIGGIFMLQARLEKYEPVTNFTTIEFDRPEPQTQDRRKDLPFDLGNNLPAQRLWQPTPGAFRQWLIDVLDPAQKKQFSKREGRMRGWSDEQYEVLVVQLKEAGLLHRSEISNHAPVCTDEGKRLAREWLKR